MTLSTAEYEAILRRDLMSFFERSFYELNPQTMRLRSPHLEVIAARLDSSPAGRDQASHHPLSHLLRMRPSTPYRC